MIADKAPAEPGGLAKQSIGCEPAGDPVNQAAESRDEQAAADPATRQAEPPQKRQKLEHSTEEGGVQHSRTHGNSL